MWLPVAHFTWLMENSICHYWGVWHMQWGPYCWVPGFPLSCQLSKLHTAPWSLGAWFFVIYRAWVSLPSLETQCLGYKFPRYLQLLVDPGPRCLQLYGAQQKSETSITMYLKIPDFYLLSWFWALPFFQTFPQRACLVLLLQ